MLNDNKALPLESKATRIKKEIEYLHRQFPWKTQDEIAAIFSETGEVDFNALKQLSTVHMAAETIED